MTEDEAYTLIGVLVAAGHSGWNDEGVNLCAAEMQTWHDREAAQTTITTLARTWSEQWRPTLHDIVSLYHAERERNARDAQAAIEPPKEYFPGRARGWEIAQEVYFEEYGRRMDEAAGSGVDLAIEAIQAQKHQLPNEHGQLCWLARYTDVVRALHGDHQRAQRALTSLVADGRLHWASDGRLTLCPERVVSLLGPTSFTRPVLPSRRPQERFEPVVGVVEADDPPSLADAAAEIARRMTDDTEPF